MTSFMILKVTLREYSTIDNLNKKSQPDDKPNDCYLWTSCRHEHFRLEFNQLCRTMESCGKVDWLY